MFHLTFSLLCLVAFGASMYFYHFGFKQKSSAIKFGAVVVAVGAIVLIALSMLFRPVGHHMGDAFNPPPASVCPMMEMQRSMMNMGGCGCGGMSNIEVQHPPITPDKYHQPVKHLMTDPMEAKPKK